MRAARTVLRAYSSSFFLVTRFLPAPQRAEVEVTYAAVRYPDEIVDTFPLTAAQKLARLDEWERQYREALRLPGLGARLQAGLPWILCGFTTVVVRRKIPPEHYLAFLDAMRRDVQPSPFSNFASLVDDYVYGSAVVVGYFLTHIYGTADGCPLEDALLCARELGIALQLTNFARDVEEDRRRGRLYVPRDVLARFGVRPEEALNGRRPQALERGARWLAEQAESRYEFARRSLPVFAAECRAAIRACIDVYQSLNRRLLENPDLVSRRLRLSPFQKFRLLPSDKYWRVPLAYARLL